MVIGAREVELLADGCLPQAGDDRELLLEPVEAFGDRRKRDTVGGVLALEPARAEPEFDTSVAHMVDARHRDCQRAGKAKRGGAHHRAESQPRRLDGEAGERRPSVGGAWKPEVGPHRRVMVGAKKAVETLLFSVLGHACLVGVGGAELRFDHDDEAHALTLSRGIPASLPALSDCGT